MSTFKAIFVIFVTFGIISQGSGWKNETEAETGLGIVGGDYAKDGQFPYAVYIDMDVIDEPEKPFEAPGTLIDLSTVVTARHVVQGNIRKITVWAGAVDRIDKVGGQKREAAYHKVHRQGDIAVIKLKEPFVATDKVQPVPICPRRPFIQGTKCTVFGWGAMEHGSNYMPKFLKFAHLDYYLCNDADEVCGSSSNNDHAYLGDSGGGFICPVESKNCALGVAFKFYCPRSSPCINTFTDLTLYHDFVQNA